MNKSTKLSRRAFVKNAGVLAFATSIIGNKTIVSLRKTSLSNKLPKWKGFNLLDFFSPDPSHTRITPEDYFRWMRDWGFDFVRIPIAYPNYLDIDRSKNITAEDVYKIDEKRVALIDGLVTMAHQYNIHVSLNLHRAPGYCINAGFYEPYNLWTDQAAQDAFCFHWQMWAKRYKNISSKKNKF